MQSGERYAKEKKRNSSSNGSGVIADRLYADFDEKSGVEIAGIDRDIEFTGRERREMASVHHLLWR